jgi:hypothetical protein
MWLTTHPSAETKNDSSYTCTPLHAFMACKETTLPLVYRKYMVVITEFLM